MAIDIYKEDDYLVLSYEAEYPVGNNAKWVLSKLELETNCTIAKCFYFKKDDIIDYDKEQYTFVNFKIAELISLNDTKYYKVPKRILNIHFDLLFEESCDIWIDYFFTKRKLSIFKIIDEIGIGNTLIVGGTEENSISEKEYKKILASLPSYRELDLYDNARVYSTLKNYFSVNNDKEFQFNRYVEKKTISKETNHYANLAEIDIERYTYILELLKQMLKDELSYSEADWQREIIKIIQIIFPKYVIAVRESKILKGIAKKDKHIDILLGDVNGNIDIIEIKKPAGIELLRKNPYRENYIPSAALQGAVMQAEKYIFYLMKNGKIAEESLDKQTEKIRDKDYHFKIINPKSIIIMGHTSNYTQQQKDDFEVIKRKYTNVLDIISYEDLIHRLETIINTLKVEKRD